MIRPRLVLRPSRALMSARLLLQQIGLALLVFAISVIWLRIPDAGAIDVAASVLLALVVLTIAGAGESAIILRLVNRRPTPIRFSLGTLFLILGVSLWLACSSLLHHAQANDPLRAGYLNSQFSHSMRNVFSYDHILLWMGWLWTFIQAACAALITLFAVVLTASNRPHRAIQRSLHSIVYWVTAVFGIPSAIAVTNILTRWTPGHGLRTEALSLALRLILAVLIDGTLVCLLLAILAACIRQADAIEASTDSVDGGPQVTPTGKPEESQPRTVDNP